jgi:C1A family cysteine protease
MTSYLEAIYNFFSGNITKYVDLIKSLPLHKVKKELDNLYNAIPKDDFVNVIKKVYKDLSPDQYAQKIIDLYKSYPIDKLNTTINDYYKTLKNIVNIGNTKFQLDTYISIKTQSDKNITNYLSASPLPASLDLRSKMTPVRNQGADGCCVAFATCAMKEFQNNKIDYYKNYLSPWFIYLKRSDPAISGMTPKNALDILQNYGVTTELEFPYLKAKSKDEITDKIYDTAKNFMIKDYAYVNNIDDLKQALHQNGPCTIAFPCYNSSPTFWKSNSGDKLLGGHCVLVVGYDVNKGFLIRNSWGEFWGDRGYTWFPYNDWGMQNEIWTTLDFVNTDRKKIIDETVIIESKKIQIKSSLGSPSENNSYIIIVVIMIVIVSIIFGLKFLYYNKKK